MSEVTSRDMPVIGLVDPASAVESELAVAAHRDDVVQDLPASENKRFYPALDGLRAVAVLMVFCQHYFDQRPALNWGWTGVDIFFVLSGFLITGILYDTRDTAHRFRNFYVRRTLRIFPLYYGVLLVVLLTTPIFRWATHPIWFLWPLYLENYGRFLWLADFHNHPYVIDHLLSTKWQLYGKPLVLFLGHFWSLCVEEQFYLVWPPIVFLVKDRVRLRNLCLAAMILAMCGRFLCIAVLPENLLRAGFIERFTLLRMDSLLLGGLVALGLRGPEASFFRKLALPAIFVTTGTFCLMELFSLLRDRQFYAPHSGAHLLQTVGYLFIDVFAAGIILRAIQPETIISQLLQQRYLRRLGQISYGFYVFHDIFHNVYFGFVQHTFPHTAHLGPLVGLFAFFGTCVLAFTSFRFFETPFLRLKAHFTV